MGRSYESITKDFAKELGKEILNSKQIDKTNHPFKDFPFENFLYKRIGFEGEVKDAHTNNRAIEEHLNEVGPANWIFKVTGVDSNRAYRIKMIKKKVWEL